MALCQINFRAPSLDKMAGMNVIVPEDHPGPWSVFYLLHGLSDDHTVWTRYTSIERHVAGLPLAVVMPSTERQWYTNSQALPGLAYEDHIIKDVIGFVDRTFPTNPSRSGRVIGGLSMGGYGCVKLALKYPQLFCAASSHSGALMHVHSLRRTKIAENDHPVMKELIAVMGSQKHARENDCYYLATKCPPSNRPDLHIDCGIDDHLLTQNRMFHKHLNDLGYDHEYAEFPGGHNWEYWDRHVPEAIAFHRRVMGI